MTIESNDATPQRTLPEGGTLRQEARGAGALHAGGAREVVPPRQAQPRADTIGSLLRGDAVVRAARRSSPADGALLNDAARDAIMLQEEIGLDVITDGEVRRVSWAQTPRFVDAFTTSTAADAGSRTRSGTDSGGASLLSMVTGVSSGGGLVSGWCRARGSPGSDSR